MIISFSPYFMAKRLLYILGLKALAIIAVILYAGIGLGPDEAQYWTWSQALDWGYYSKPPGIAWQIWLGTKLFGHTEWGVRSLTVLMAILQSLAVYQLALRAGLLPRTAFWCGLLMALSPLGIMGSLFAITDVGFLLCWTGACLAMVSALDQKKAPDPLQIGGWILVGALFKWPIYSFWIFYLCCNYWYFPQQSKFRLGGGIFISLLGLLPSVWWNWSHDWATFRHVFATLQGGSSQRAAGNLAEFLGSQLLLLSPIIFILLIAALWQWMRQRERLSPALFFCGFVTFSSLTFVSLLACFQKIQGNWITLAYPTGLVILGWNAFQEHPSRAWWAKVGLSLSVILVSLIFIFPSLYMVPKLSSYTPSYRFNPFKHNMGWVRLQQALESQGYQPKKHFLLSDKYQTASILSFYGEGQQRAYFLNLQSVRKNQFSYWPSLQEEREGQIGYFVWIENLPYLKNDWHVKLNFYQQQLSDYFDKVEFLEIAPLVYDGSKIAKAAFIFRCQNCKSTQPVETKLY